MYDVSFKFRPWDEDFIKKACPEGGVIERKIW